MYGGLNQFNRLADIPFDRLRANGLNQRFPNRLNRRILMKKNLVAMGFIAESVAILASAQPYAEYGIEISILNSHNTYTCHRAC